MLLRRHDIGRPSIAAHHHVKQVIGMMPARTLRTRTRFQTNDTVTYQDKIIEEHNQIRHTIGYFHKYHDAQTRQKLGYLLIRELSMHGSKEEEIIYPVAREVLGEDAFHRLLSAHQAMKVDLEKLGSMDPEKDMKAYEEQFDAVVDTFRLHGLDEELHEYPQLTQLIGPERAVDLAKKWEEASVRVATRPHSWVKTTGFTKMAADLLSKPVDELRDRIRFEGVDPENLEQEFRKKDK